LSDKPITEIEIGLGDDDDDGGGGEDVEKGLYIWRR